MLNWFPQKLCLAESIIIPTIRLLPVISFVLGVFFVTVSTTLLRLITLHLGSVPCRHPSVLAEAESWL